MCPSTQHSTPAHRSLFRGFTLIELMFVVAIISILAAIALPAYQDYVIRARLTEGFTLASGLQRSVADYYGHQGAWPADNQQAGLPPPDHFVGQYVARVAVEHGALHIVFRETVHALESQRTMTLRPAVVVSDFPASTLSWVCGYAEPAPGMRTFGENQTTLPPKFLPNTCRN